MYSWYRIHLRRPRMMKRTLLSQQFFCVIPVCAVFFMVGVARSWLAPILNEATDPNSELPLTLEQSSWIASLSSVTQALSPIPFFLLVDRVGRKSVIILSALISFVVWIGVYWSRNVLVHYGLRLLSGLYMGTHYMVSSIYVCENCSPELRGTFLSLVMMFRYTGQVLVYALATFCSYSEAAAVYCVLAFIALLSTLLLVETPQFLLMKGKRTKAELNFARLRNKDDADTAREFEAMKENVEEEKRRTFSLATFRSKEVSRSIQIVWIQTALFTGNGWVAVNSFMTKLFASPVNGYLSANELSLYCSLLHLLSVGTSTLFVDRVNRRMLIIVSSAATSITLTGIVILYRIQSTHYFPNFQLFLFVLFTVFSCVDTGLLFPMVTLLSGELLPQTVKRMGNSLATVTSSLVFFATSATFLLIAEAFGMETNFVIFTVCAVLMTVYAYYSVPETRGRTLIEIQNELKDMGKRERD